MVRHNHSLYDNDNYVSNTLFKSESKNNRHLYYDDKMTQSKESENIDDIDARIFMQKSSNVSINNSKGSTHEKPGYNSSTSNIDSQSSPYTSYDPFISIIVPARNEHLVIDRLMRSCAALTYNRDNFEIIVVDDDSEDNTYDIVKKWTDKIPNLKIVRRSNRSDGWKGGVLNLALKNMNINSSYILVVDADNILPSNILEVFVSCFTNFSPKAELNGVNVIQGYPMPLLYSDSNDNRFHNLERSIIGNGRSNTNWVARAINFRLAQRYMIEFAAKDRMNLPLQIVGSLFMIRSEVIRSIGFSNDLSEDWDLTLDLYLSLSCNHSFINMQQQYYDKFKSKNAMIIRFDPSLVSYYDPITSLISYLRQRMRVSEGHTRGFRRKFVRILSSKMLYFTDKIELLFTGLQYAKFISLFGIIVIDLFMILLNTQTGLLYMIGNNDLLKLTLLVQAANLFTAIGIACMSMHICHNIRNYNTKDILYFLFLTLLTIPFVMFGSIRGLVTNEGIFYRTERNS
jgi:cellulose synthase/poly-beta-1,6-N-acetylglucosamine synthase-like glycosyltransferase